MTAEEFVQARTRLGWSTTDVAARYNLTPRMVTAIEAGSLKPPRKVAADLAYRAAIAEREALLEEAGLPVCAEAEALSAPFADPDGASARGMSRQAILAALEALERHTAACPLCIARDEHLRKHAPPLPKVPLDPWMHAFVRAVELADRLPPRIRPPAGDAGEGRRMGVFLATGFSLIAAVIVALGVIIGIASGDLTAAGKMLGLLLWVLPGYYVGFYLAGSVFDATRRIRHRLGGYLVRGTLAPALVYGTVGLAVPYVDPEATWMAIPIITCVMAVVGCIAGAVMWVWHRIRGGLPTPVPREPGPS